MPDPEEFEGAEEAMGELSPEALVPPVRQPQASRE